MAGETTVAERTIESVIVSIRSRHRWREKRRCASSVLPTQCFNPLPPSMAGETDAVVDSTKGQYVSIRSRHRWREKRVVVDECDGDGSFNPLPPSMAGEALPGQCGRPPGLFQSAPAIDGGRNAAQQAPS